MSRSISARPPRDRCRPPAARGPTGSQFADPGAARRPAAPSGDVRVLDAAGHRDDHGRRAVSAPVVPGDLGAGQALDRLQIADDRPGDRQAVEHAAANASTRASSGLSSRMANSSRITWRSTSTSAARDGGVEHHVADQVDRQLSGVGQHVDEVAGVLVRGERVEVAADTVDGHSDVTRAAGPGALEQQVLEEMRSPGELRLFVDGTDADPDADGRAARPRHPFGDQSQAAGDFGEGDLRPSADRSRTRVRVLLSGAIRRRHEISCWRQRGRRSPQRSRRRRPAPG